MEHFLSGLVQGVGLKHEAGTKTHQVHFHAPNYRLEYKSQAETSTMGGNKSQTEIH